MVLPVEGPPYRRAGSIGEFGGPITRKNSRIWDFRPGRRANRSSVDMGSVQSDSRGGGCVGGGSRFGVTSEGFKGVAEEDLVTRRAGVCGVPSSPAMAGIESLPSSPPLLSDAAVADSR